MASAWGDSFGVAWGVSWAAGVAPEPDIGGGGGGDFYFSIPETKKKKKKPEKKLPEPEIEKPKPYQPHHLTTRGTIDLPVFEFSATVEFHHEPRGIEVSGTIELPTFGGIEMEAAEFYANPDVEPWEFLYASLQDEPGLAEVLVKTGVLR